MTLPPGDPSLLETIEIPEASSRGITIDILRLDRIHPVVSGNKWFKLKGHLKQARQLSANTIITFGGAWSNHLIATAFAANQTGLKSIGIVRGERAPILSTTLSSALGYGMQLEFVTRGRYTKKSTAAFLDQLSCRYPGGYVIPEGGAGSPGILGSEDILRTTDSSRYTHILCAVGTGTMFMGLIRSSSPGQLVVGVPVLKGVDPISTADPAVLSPQQKNRARLLEGYHFGGYARHPQALLTFMNDFYRRSGVPSDIVYTGKLLYAMEDAIRVGYFPISSKLLVIHSGGLQGNSSLGPGVLEF